MTRHHPNDIARIRQLCEELDNPDGAVGLTMITTVVGPVLTPSPEFPPGHPRSAWPTVELADGPDLAAAIDEVYSTACPECGADVGHLCEAREDAASLPERTPHIARVLATTILDCAWQEPTAHPALRAKWDAAYQDECRSVFGIPDAERWTGPWRSGISDDPRDQLRDLPGGRWAEVGPGWSSCCEKCAGWNWTVLDLTDTETLTLATGRADTEHLAKLAAEDWAQT